MGWLPLRNKDKNKKPATAKDSGGRPANISASGSGSMAVPTIDRVIVPRQITPVRSMPEGRGGMFAFGRLAVKQVEENPLKPQPGTVHALHPYEYIGTSNCYTCVAVYFEVGDNLCFCAHLNLDFGSGEPHPPNSKAVEDMIRHIYNTFSEYQKRQGWRNDSVKPETLVIVSPALNKACGIALLRMAIPFCLGLEYDDPRITISDKAHGFVIRPGQPSSMVMMPYSSMGELTTRFRKLDGYRLDGDISMPAKEWSYLHGRGPRPEGLGDLNPKIAEALSTGILE